MLPGPRNSFMAYFEQPLGSLWLRSHDLGVCNFKTYLNMLSQIKYLYLIFTLLGGFRIFGSFQNNPIFLPVLILSLFRGRRVDGSAAFLLLALFFGLVGAFLSADLLTSSVFVIFTCFSFFSVSIGTTSLAVPYFAIILSAFSWLNAIICVIQVHNPQFIVVPHISDDYHIQMGSSFANILPWFPSLGRLSGIFIENGPMVIAIAPVTYFLVAYIHQCIYLHNKAKRLSFFFVGSAILANLLLIAFTGSKFFPLFIGAVLIYKFLLLPSLEVFNPILRRLFLLLKRFPVFLMIGLAMPFIFGSLLIQFLDHALGLDLLVNVQSLASRTATPSIHLWLGSGMASTSSEQIPTLNGMYIYPYALGLIPGSLFLIFSSAFILFPSPSFLVILMYILSIVGSGSLLNFQYPIFIIISRLLVRIR